MKHAPSWTLVFIVAALLALGSTPALADSVGPYYATPSWDQQLPASTRFIVLSNWASAAVLDRETGLVWEKSPSGTVGIFLTWFDAQSHCNRLTTGGRLGWRLPTLQELESLVDRSVSPGPTLPTGHPFSNVQLTAYWSATSDARFPATDAWTVFFDTGAVGSGDAKGDTEGLAWCVRGGQGVDPQ
jgi:uncharacterized protein DUF1566